MSMTLMAKAMSIKVGNSLRKLVLIKLADNANDKGECWPSYQHIADQCECSKSAVRDHIDALIESGFLKKENRLGNNNGKGNASNLYYLNLNAKHMPPESTPPVPPADIPMPNDGTPMPPESTPPVPPAGTRTSHSLEPVKEPVIKEKRSRKQKTVFVLPNGLNLEAWGLWIEYRKQSNLKAYSPTPMSAGVQAEKLISLAGGDLKTQMMIVQQSINGPWTGLYPLKDRNQFTGQSRQPMSNIQAAQQAAREAKANGWGAYDDDTIL